MISCLACLQIFFFSTFSMFCQSPQFSAKEKSNLGNSFSESQFLILLQLLLLVQGKRAELPCISRLDSLLFFTQINWFCFLEEEAMLLSENQNSVFHPKNVFSSRFWPSRSLISFCLCMCVHVCMYVCMYAFSFVHDNSR